MRKISAMDVVNATGGELVLGKAETWISNISIDSRKTEAGSLFFALKGERADGHDFIKDAVKKGCTAVVFNEDVDLSFAGELKGSAAFIKVGDAQKALQELAAWYLSLFSLHKIGVTGSTGKTTTKEMLYRILSEKYKVICNKGNYNNLIGLPLSIFQVDEETEAAVFEMGMDRLGEIDRLSEIVKPHIAIITNIGFSHLASLGSRGNIMKAKTEICSHLGKGDVLVINADNEMLSGFVRKGDYEVVTVGGRSSSDVHIDSIKNMGEKGISFQLGISGKHEIFHISAPGVHNSINAGLAVAAAHRLGIDIKQAARGLEKFAAADKRLNIITKDGVKIIDDTYNASPDSMEAAIDVLASTKSVRKIAIFGDMFELGEEEEKYHLMVGEYASQKGINVVISVGKNAEYISKAARERGTDAFHFTDKEMLVSVMSQWIRKGDAILIKGSRGMAMEEVVKQLKEIRIE